MKQHSARYGVGRLCAAVEVARSGYYAWCSRGHSRRTQHEAGLVETLWRVHREHREAYGALKLWRTLRARDIRCGKHQVARLRRLHGITAKRQRSPRAILARQFVVPAAPDLLQQRFVAGAPNQVWAGDMTFIRTAEGWLHLAVLLDLYSRKVVGWAMHERPGQELHVAALTMAITQRRPPPGLIHHSDRGAQYRSHAYTQLLARHQIRASMNGGGVPQDNAVAESFFSTLKNELVHHRRFQSRNEGRSAIFSYVEGFYNRHRIHQSLGYRTPDQVDRDGDAPL